METERMTARKWITFVLVGLAGQFAWSIENMYLNTYLYYLNYTDPSGLGFNYSLMIAITTALSAVVATLTTIFMGTLTDRVRKRKIFITIGYIVWGLATASFGLLNIGSAETLLPISMTAMTAAIMVIVLDCLMTFFGSTANDAAFSSYVTKNTSDKDRGKVEGVLSILPLVAMLIIFVGLNGLTTKDSGYRWDLFFYIVGGVVSLIGVISTLLIPKEKEEEKTAVQEGYLSRLIEGFKPSTVKSNKRLYLVLIAYFIYGVAIQVFFPYLMVYIERTCEIPNSGSSFLTPFAIVMAIALLLGSLLSVLLGFFSDKKSKLSMILPICALLAIGLLCMFFIPEVKNDTARTIYAAFSGTLMIAGYVSVPTILNSLVKDFIPKGREGSFMGVRMIFVVALPMCIGPFIGDALNASYGVSYTNEYNVTSAVPSPYGYIVGLIILLLVIVPFIFLIKKPKDKNLGYLLKDLLPEDKLITLNEVRLTSHPRPSFRRDSFLSLNGKWDYLISKEDKLPTSYSGEIMVPYAVESPLSGVNHLLEIDEFIFYHKLIKIPEVLRNYEHLFLCFEGVDQEATIYVDGKEVLKHIGGYTRFSFDLKSCGDKDEYDVIIKVRDVTDSSYHMTGKQRLVPNGWFYSSSSGIYKSVYLEGRGSSYITAFKVTPDFDKQTIKVKVDTNIIGHVNIEIEGEKFEIYSSVETELKLKNFHLWSLDDPYLYQVKLSFEGDVVYSYFGLRKVEVKLGPDKKNHIYLNDKRLIINGLLDQGYYDQGILTPLSYDDYFRDVENVKKLGYNCLRKHLKVEEENFYYACDKLGLLLIQDIPCGGERIAFLNTVFPRASIKLLNGERFLTYKRYGRQDEKGREEFIEEAKEITTSLSFSPAIIMITIFNEAWGEFDPDKLYDIVKSLAEDKLIDTASGWHLADKRDIYSIHSYTVPLRKREDTKLHKPYVLTEIGGASLVTEHFVYPKVFGHHVCKNVNELTQRYQKLYQGLIPQIKNNELEGLIYTQLSDCEGEANGIYTSDRSLLKLDSAVIEGINKEISGIEKSLK